MFLTGWHWRRPKFWSEVACANPKCREPLKRTKAWERATRWQLCPSCRLAFGRGALLAGVVGFLYHLVAR